MAGLFEQAPNLEPDSQHAYDVAPVLPPEPTGAEKLGLVVGNALSIVGSSRSRLEQMRTAQQQANFAWMRMDGALDQLETAHENFEAHMDAQSASFRQGNIAPDRATRTAHGNHHRMSVAMAVEDRYRTATNSVHDVSRGADQIIALARGTHGYNTLGANPEAAQDECQRLQRAIMLSDDNFDDRDAQHLKDSLAHLPDTARAVVARSLYEQVLAKGHDTFERLMRALQESGSDTASSVSEARSVALATVGNLLYGLGVGDKEAAAVHATIADTLLWPAAIRLQAAPRRK